MAERPIRVGLVGAGSIAQIAELPALAALPGVAIAGVVTETAASARANLERWPIERSYESFEAMLSGARLDALFVLTPKQLHRPFVSAALEAGIDVFCEKPLATTLEDARAMAGLAERTGRLLMVGFNRRYAEVYRRAREEFRERPVQFCVAQKNRPGSEYRATLENAIHMIDLLRWFCGEAETVTAHTTAPDPYHEDGTLALIRFAGGAIGSLVAARTAGEWDERFDVYGSRTSVRVVAPDSLAITRDGETRLIEMRPRASGWAQVNTTMGFGPEVAHFVECVRERRQPLTDGREAVRTQELVEEILRAAGLPLADRPPGA
ncbi:MAG: Gfo/Idh/MocA family oxidoreductase [Chloroflexota bacterium]